MTFDHLGEYDRKRRKIERKISEMKPSEAEWATMRKKRNETKRNDTQPSFSVKLLRLQHPVSIKSVTTTAKAVPQNCVWGAHTKIGNNQDE